MKTFCLSKIFSLLILLSVRQNSYTQNENFYFEKIGTEEGLSNDNVTAILQDKTGYIWFGTMDGLDRYDGYTFTKYRFNPFDPNSLSQNGVYSIFEDKSGTLWVSTFEGLCKLDRSSEKFTRYKPLPNAKFSDPNISAINEDTDGMIWVGSHSGGLCRFDPKSGKFLPENFDLGFRQLAGDKEALHDGITCIYQDRKGTLWVGNKTGLHHITLHAKKAGQLSEINIKHFNKSTLNPDSLSSNFVSSVFEDHAGIFWIATDKGLNSFDPRTGKFKQYLNDPKNIQSISSNYLADWGGAAIQEDKEGNLWICTNKGLNKLNRKRTIFTVYTHNPNDRYSISSDVINFLEIDLAGILWAGSWTGLLNKVNLNNKGFGLRRQVPGKNNSLSNKEVTCIAEDSSGLIWIGTNGGGLNRWERKTNHFTHFRRDPGNSRTLKNDSVLAMLEDRHGHLWVCNGEVLSKLNKQTGEFTHYNTNERNYKDLDHRTILSITEDKAGLLWLGTGSGIKSFDETTGTFIHYYYNPADTNGLSDYTALSVFADSRNNIWVGHGSIATDRFNKQTGRFKRYSHNPNDTTSISSNIVNSFYEDTKGNLWLGTFAGGLCYFDYKKEKFITFTDKNGLPDNSVYSILEDNKNHLWLGTGNGLSRFDPNTKTFTNYDHKDGLQSRVFIAGHRGRPARCKGKDGILYFGGPNGFNFFDPAQIKSDSIFAPVVITRFKVFDNLVKGANELKEIVLDHDQNYFSFEFSSLSYFNPAKNQFAYQLEGVDKDWVYSGSRHYAGYTNIAPGTYTFKVKATNNDGIWNEKGTYITIRIRPPWWLTWWAYCLYGGCFVAGIFLIDRYQRKRLIIKERERAREKELEQAHEIEKAYHKLKTTQAQLIQSEKMASLGELTAGIAHEIQNPLNFVNNFSDLSNELIEEMKEELDKGDVEEAKAIASDIKENLGKINHHGKRAESIVTSMLQHSRASTGQKQITDINKLADEYLRLAYHGTRAKDKSFNCDIITDFDLSISGININPQDIGRVILNLVNNAFYAVNEKSKAGKDDYKPRVTVITKRLENKVEISVADNGIGITQNIVNKIFNPFFTTKPTGQGTGLGLSLSYDILKAHGGEIKVETKEEEGSVFIISLKK